MISWIQGLSCSVPKAENWRGSRSKSIASRRIPCAVSCNKKLTWLGNDMLSYLIISILFRFNDFPCFISFHDPWCLREWSCSGIEIRNSMFGWFEWIWMNVFLEVLQTVTPKRICNKMLIKTRGAHLPCLKGRKFPVSYIAVHSATSALLLCVGKVKTPCVILIISRAYSSLSQMFHEHI